MIDPNFDPYEELINLRLEVEILKNNLQVLIKSHNRLTHENTRLRKWLTEQQQTLFELGHNIDKQNHK